jgi:uncharacterized membrane protein YqhA
MNYNKNMIVKFLAACRYLLLIPVFGCIIMTAGTVLMGLGRIVTSVKRIQALGGFSPKASKLVSVSVIEIIDLFLVATIAYIAAIGLYKLFIDKKKIEFPMRIKINSLNDLENKIVGVIIAALAVAFLGNAASAENYTSILYYGGGIGIVIVALTIFLKFNKDEKKDKPAD